MTNDMLELISLVANPILIRVFALLILFVLITSIKHHTPKE
jgi:hypothetical protein